MPVADQSPASPWLGESAIAAVAIVRSSAWHERDATGRTLVTEQGRLAGAGLTWRARLGPLAELHAGLSQAGGERAYDGQTNAGAAARTRTTLTDTQLQAGLASLPATSGWSAGWSVGLQAQLDQVDRRLHDTAQATGYTERWRWASLAPQLRWQGSVQGGGQAVDLTAALALGRVWWTDLRLNLPQRDETRLVPGGGRTRELTLAARIPLGGVGTDTDKAVPGRHWAVLAGWRWADTRFGVSPVVAVLRNGQLGGGALQPATVTRHRDLNLGLTLAW